MTPRAAPAVLRDVASLRAWRRVSAGEAGGAGGGSVGFVPTMGALHAGHGRLIERARAENDRVLVSVFVNPLQFDRQDDLAAYPRDLDADLALCARLGVDAVFAPGVADLYPRRPLVRVDGGALGSVVEGAARPGHFDGMLTVVLKLLNLAGADRAYFGRKDAQQLALVRAMVADLDVPVEIVGVATERDPDGLAMSSRNRRLSPAERADALAIPAALDAARGAVAGGLGRALAAARDRLAASALRVDYVELVDPVTFEVLAPEAADTAGAGLLVIAAWAGPVRLIDNELLEAPAPARRA